MRRSSVLPRITLSEAEVHAVENLMQYLSYCIIKNMHSITGLTIAVKAAPRFVIADVTNALDALSFTVCKLDHFPIGG
jgi:hypothetical protein